MVTIKGRTIEVNIDYVVKCSAFRWSNQVHVDGTFLNFLMGGSTADLPGADQIGSGMVCLSGPTRLRFFPGR